MICELAIITNGLFQLCEYYICLFPNVQCGKRIKLRPSGVDLDDFYRGSNVVPIHAPIHPLHPHKNNKFRPACPASRFCYSFLKQTDMGIDRVTTINCIVSARFSPCILGMPAETEIPAPVITSETCFHSIGVAILESLFPSQPPYSASVHSKLSFPAPTSKWYFPIPKSIPAKWPLSQVRITLLSLPRTQYACLFSAVGASSSADTPS